MCCLGHLVDGAIEGEFVGLGRLGEAAQFADELHRRRTNLFVRRRWLEVMQGLDVSTHSILLLGNPTIETRHLSSPNLIIVHPAVWWCSLSRSVRLPFQPF